ncbi:MAG: 4-hydroxy-tetrahydrodipicolinate reductase [Lachnospiraceae bacterium]|nr:4-hydroxy-tetrahydrodipicolinate reductase [Lachnospiraceae bacterium]
MVDIILHGCSGFMGQVVTDIAAADADVRIVAGIDVADRGNKDYPVYTEAAQCRETAECIIDFSNAKAIDGLLDYAIARSLPVVLCTTGLTEAQLGKVEDASKKIAILRSANMSLGVNLLLKLLKEAAATLAPAGYDMEVEEMHHRRKVDAPSGTAIALAEALNEGAGGEYHFTYDRSQRTAARDDKEIGVSALRGGTVVGIHDVIFAGQDEVVEFKHTAYSRAIFAKGAVAAAKFLAGKAPGMYNMADVIG